MKILFVSFITILISANIQSQTFDSFFNMGVEEFNNGNLRKADSLFTLSIEKFANKNAYYNRGMVRKVMNNNCGFCEDMMVSYLYFDDNEAITQFGDNCMVEADTLYITQKYLSVDKISKHRYVDVTYKPLCSDISMGLIIDNKRKHTIMGTPPTIGYNPLNMRFQDIHLYAIYYLIDTMRVYTTFVKESDLYFVGQSKKKLKKKVVNLLTDDPSEKEKYIETDIFTFLTINNNRELIDIKVFIADSNGKDLIEFEDQVQKVFEPLKTYFDNYYRYPKAKVFKKTVTVQYSLIL